AVRSRAREVGWMLGTRNKPKTTRLTGLAHALRSTAYDEDDVISDALAQAAAGTLEQAAAAAAAAEFEAVQEIAALRSLMRALVRLQAEHADADVRRSTGELLARLSGGEKKALRMPVPRAVASGPSFFFPAHAFARRAGGYAHAGGDAGDACDAGDSSSDDDNDDGDGDDGCSDSECGSDAAGGGGGRSRAAPARGAHWERAFAEALDAQWPLGAPHVFQLLQAQPHSGYALAATFGAVLRVQRSTVGERDAHCLFAAAAAQAGCYPLVCLAEARALAACGADDAGACEAWLTHGLRAAPAKTQLLARFGARLRERPWLLAADDVARYVAEYVSIHAAAHGLEQAALPLPAVAAVLSRRSVEESALRDLLHAVVVMAVAHGLGAFATACGVVPDLDQPAGSFFPQAASAFMAAETIPGLPHVQTLLPQPPTLLPQPPALLPLEPAFVDHVERNTAEMIARLQQPPYAAEPSRQPEHSFVSDACMASFMPWIQQQSLPPPPAALLRTLPGGSEARAAAYARSLAHVVDPLTSPAQHFDAYRHMRARKLAKYARDQPLPSDAAAAAREPLLAPSDCDQPQEGKAVTATVHLTTREDLRWDSLSSYLRQKLSIDDDYLGREIQAARCVGARPFADATMPINSPLSENSNAPVFVTKFGSAPLKSDSPNSKWNVSPDYMDREPADDDLKPKCYSMSNVFSIPHHSNTDRSMYQSTAPNAAAATTLSSASAAPSQVVDARQFHDAIWHFTLSLYHIYEEYYFYSKFKDEMTPESTQPAIDIHEQQYGAMPIPSPHPNHKGLAVAGISVDTDFDMDMSHSSSQNHFASGSPIQYSKWLTEELKLHIRSVVRNPASIQAMAAQPPIATGLNLCIEEMVHVNLIISLAKRQAELIHGIRAIREYEENPARF
ncbi:hypothetical protein GGF42_002803, partial [Coemansia sp. RSA 2424]